MYICSAWFLDIRMSPDSISDGVIFQNFPRGMPPDLLVLCFAHYECNMPASLYTMEALMMALIA